MPRINCDCVQSRDILIYIYFYSFVCDAKNISVSVSDAPFRLAGFYFACHGAWGGNYASRSWTRRSKRRAATHTHIACVGQGRIYLLLPSQLGKRNGQKEGVGCGLGLDCVWARRKGEAAAVQGYLQHRNAKKTVEMNIELFVDRAVTRQPTTLSLPLLLLLPLFLLLLLLLLLPHHQKKSVIVSACCLRDERQSANRM